MSKWKNLNNRLEESEKEMKRPKSYSELNKEDRQKVALYFLDDPEYMKREDFITMEEFLEGYLFYWEEYGLSYIITKFAKWVY